MVRYDKRPFMSKNLYLWLHLNCVLLLQRMENKISLISKQVQIFSILPSMPNEEIANTNQYKNHSPLELHLHRHHWSPVSVLVTCHGTGTISIIALFRFAYCSILFYQLQAVLLRRRKSYYIYCLKTIIKLSSRAPNCSKKAQVRHR